MNKENEKLLNEIIKDTTNVQYGASGGNVKVGNSNMGDFYYTGSTTAYMNHGHVGMYYSKDLIVESVPDKGVRTIATNKRLVDKGDAVVKSVNTSWQNKMTQLGGRKIV